MVCTIQTFPFALEAVRKLAATEGKRFAVIADEAQLVADGRGRVTAQGRAHGEELAELADGGEVSTEDVLAAQMAARADDGGITFVAFTATPKNKTMELFGTRPDPSRKPAPDNVPAPFHVYSMRQAIEEKFILDVLQNYTPTRWPSSWRTDGEEQDSTEVERSAALKKIMGWVKLHPYNIAQKVEVVVEHFRREGRPAAWTATPRRWSWWAAGSRRCAGSSPIEKYIKEQGYKIGTLVAFSGEVIDPESGPRRLHRAEPRA